jgi:hypothetical protein
MTRRTRRSTGLTTAEQVQAVFTLPALYELGALIEHRPAGRPAQYPPYLMLGYGVLARVFRSGARVEIELAQPATWQIVTDVITRMRTERPDLAISPPPRHPPGWDAYKYARNRRLTADGVLEELCATFTEIAVEQAQDSGLLRPDGGGSLCHPERSRVVYGDGTVVSPLYRPPVAKRVPDGRGGTRTVYLDADGKTIPRPRRRYDPDSAEHHGHSGPVHGQNFVGLYARGDAPHQRIVLAVGRVPRPGAEAETAVELLKTVHAAAGAGMQAVVYDGALRGKHIEELMTACGVLVINKVHSSSRSPGPRRVTPAQGNPRWHVLGTWEHDTAAGACHHSLAALDGAVSEVGLDAAGSPVALARLVRRQVKRPLRANGRYHFVAAYTVPCSAGDFLAWVSPHPQHSADTGRPDAVRLIAEGEPDFTRLYPIRSDSESQNSAFKRTLLVDRAMSLGGRRQLLDFLCYALLTNATAAYHAAAAARPALRRVA